MTCTSRPELDDLALLTYVDGEATPDVIAHIKRCPHCRERAKRLAAEQGRLKGLEQAASAAVDELGNFILPGVIPGEYDLILSGPGLKIQIPHTQAGESAKESDHGETL